MIGILTLIALVVLFLLVVATDADPHDAGRCGGDCPRCREDE